VFIRSAKPESTNYFLWMCVLLLVVAAAAGLGFYLTNLPGPAPPAEDHADLPVVPRAERPPTPPAEPVPSERPASPARLMAQAGVVQEPVPPHVAPPYTVPAPVVLDTCPVPGIEGEMLSLTDPDMQDFVDDEDHAFNRVGVDFKDGNVLFKKRARVHYIFVDQQNYDATTAKLSVVVNLRNVTGLELHDAAMPRGAYTINSFNNQLTINSVANGDEEVTLDEGDYTASELQAELNTKCVATSAISSVGYDAKTQKFTFTGDAQDIAVKFPETLLAYTLGFGTVSIWPARDTDDNIVRTATVVSRYRCDLFGGRYLRVQCDTLRHSYGNTTIVAQSALANDITFVRHATDHLRTFVEPKQLNTLSMDLKVVAPNNTTRNYDPNGVAFNMTFIVRTEIMTADRSLEAVDNDVIVK